ncbi:hypothetical protein BMS97_01585 [Leuconostoc mesenteroides subsp. mesenteroides]|uniref:hypothetical protein n=1 Tax=Leuconostoc mesenteroides TaxID=1245 RepID=UPI000A00C308|nr:hypothetical protein [Leuconostoc mesenteroides]ARN64098.1 hypothetical protein A0F18_08625 [Leuconostoc mesenteroides subsp. mesenteroides]MDV8927610.1 hypothetical protein [Leuconostoc mesenteroides]ORI91382.1 hypothetical protein BMS97_01585 [Leuconostoc mesenteroides subsp. mesenteroides]ORI92295.1 hypothetical protein BMS98_05935 [Leuconostoc mesenteroides subsp. mesenteroides]
MNKKWFWFLIVLGAVVFVGGPLFVQYNHWPQGTKGHGDWLSFWGSYLGVVPSGIIAALVAGTQIKESNKQNHENAMQSLKVMNNTKLLNYYYDIKSSLAKSKVLFDEIDNSWKIHDLYYYLYSPQRRSFEVLNLETLLQENNMLHLNVNTVNVNNDLKGLSETLMEYSGNLIIVERMIKLYAASIDEERNILENEVDEEAKNLYAVYVKQSTHEKIMEQLSKMINLTDEKIKELSA